MATRRVCDRCGADAEVTAGVAVVRNVIVSVKDPTTNPIEKDFELTLSITPNQDLCKPCKASSLLGFVAGIMAEVGKFETRAVTAILTRSLPPAPDVKAGGR